MSSNEVNPFLIKIDSLGALDLWDPHQNYSWKIVEAQTGIKNTFSPTYFAFDISAFGDENNLSGGKFSVSVNGNDLMLNFTAAAVPEPSTGILFLAMGVIVFWFFRKTSMNGRMQ